MISRSSYATFAIMLTQRFRTLLSSFFILVLMLASAQVTVAGYYGTDGEIFSLLTNVMAEEENESSEREEESHVNADWHVSHPAPTNDDLTDLSALEKPLRAHLLSHIEEVISPPPEA